MSLALQSARYLVWFYLGMTVLGLILATTLPPGQGYGFGAMSFLIGAGVTYLVLLGLRKELTWVAVLFLLICVYGLFAGIAGGLDLSNFANLGRAVLSFVGICGILIWFRERNTDQNTA